jgi:hypothetical protein
LQIIDLQCQWKDRVHRLSVLGMHGWQVPGPARVGGKGGRARLRAGGGVGGEWEAMGGR